jgi:uncharacterized protein YecE (DUF72 family)
MKILVGTSGYSYEDWRGVFYPQNLPKGKMLDYYSQFFNCVEINSSYYNIPHSSVFHRMAEKTPPNFEFIVKLNKATTHERQSVDDAVQRLSEAVKPLIEKNKFSGFLAQFPYSFKNIPKSRDYLAKIKYKTGNLPLFVEFRNWTWDHPDIYKFLEEEQIFFVSVDEPPLKGLIKPNDIVTGDLGYIRFHGRNSENWWRGNNQTRYNYLYTKSELDGWLINLSRILKKTYKTYIFFNNHPQGKAIQNAKMLKEVLNLHLETLKK